MRVVFEKEEYRHSFFNLLKNKFIKNQKELENLLRISRKTLWQYSSGLSTIPEKLYILMSNLLDSEERKFFEDKTFSKEDNWGRIKGGKEAYKVNSKEFARGRLIGAKASKLKKQYVCPDYSLSQALCEFIGAFIGDGCFNKYKNRIYQIEFAGDSRFDEQYYIQTIIPNIVSIIPDLKPHIYRVKNTNSIRIVFYSKRLFYFIKEEFGFVPGKKAHTVTIPKRIIDSGEEYINRTIRGIFDTDGGVFIDRRDQYKSDYPRIHFETVSKKLYDQLVELLSRNFKLYTWHNEKRNSYRIEIYGKNQLKKWMKKIGFSNERHLTKVEEIGLK